MIAVASPNNLLKRGMFQSKPVEQILDPDWIATMQAPNESFVFNMNCTALNATECYEAEECLKSAGTRIAQQILLRKKVIIDVEFEHMGTKALAVSSTNMRSNYY